MYPTMEHTLIGRSKADIAISIKMIARICLRRFSTSKINFSVPPSSIPSPPSIPKPPQFSPPPKPFVPPDFQIDTPDFIADYEKTKAENEKKEAEALRNEAAESVESNEDVHDTKQSLMEKFQKRIVTETQDFVEPKKTGYLYRINEQLVEKRKVLEEKQKEEWREQEKKGLKSGVSLKEKMIMRINNLADEKVHEENRKKLMKEAFEAGYWDDIKEIARKGEKLWDAGSSLFTLAKSPLLPNVSGTTLTNKSASLYDLIAGNKCTLVIFYFSALGETHSKSYATPFLENFKDTAGVGMIQVNVEENSVKSYFLWASLGLIRKKVPIEQHDKYLILYKDIRDQRRNPPPPSKISSTPVAPAPTAPEKKKKHHHHPTAQKQKLTNTAVLKLVKNLFLTLVLIDIVWEMTTPITPDRDDNTVIVVLGASGDLAFKKTYPALFGLYKNQFLPSATQIVGYARSDIKLDDFRKRVSSRIKTKNEVEKRMLDNFLDICTYVAGKYDDVASFTRLNKYISTLEAGHRGDKHRVFYMALPPSVFIPASAGLKAACYLPAPGTNRLVVEKPFGHDLSSAKELSVALAQNWAEDEIYRIDHYLGKEMVKNLMVLRFGNVFLGAVWNRFYINNIQITFKEKIGTEGRGGYFDEFGIIRDVMQNHLLQILSIIAMEKPVSLDAEDVRNEKVKVLRCIAPLKKEDTLLGQYVTDGKTPGYQDDPTVPNGSKTPTFAIGTLYIENERWDGVPFILKCGKALDNAKAEIRIQFQDVAGKIYDDIARNELVIRVQPDEAVYMKMMTKMPGLSSGTTISELDLSYNKRFKELVIPDAYESLILDVLKGDKSNFVRDDELDAAWKIFTPILHEIDAGGLTPEPYVFGTRGPKSLDSFVQKHGYHRPAGYDYANL
ncbi:Glucose-6-phosphate 1-dehydrogenase [Nowakowskiella sp. JEL0407]|nr:Glucose-6-phosphate 1-dehydrogenase [Nowakowskiella sp. JEL0407]